MRTSNRFVFRTEYIAASALTLLLAANTVPAGTIVWQGTSGTDTNWSNGANWVGGVAPGGGDDVKFFNIGTNAAANIPNNLVDSGFAGFIGSLQYGNTNGFHTTSIAAGQTLNITNTGGVFVGTPTDIAVADTNRVTISGLGATLNVNNTNANISLNQGTATGVNFSQSILDLSGLGTFTANINRIGIGTTTTINPGNANQREAGTLILALTNNITVNYAMPLATYQTLGSATNSIELQKNPGNNGGSTTPSTLLLGLNNVLNIDSIGIGRDKSDASCLGRMMFNPAVLASSPVANFYGVSGPGSRVTWYAVGDGAANASSSHGGYGTNDFSGGTVNAFVNVLSLGRDCSAQSTWAGPDKGVLTFTAGTIDINTLILGNQSLGPLGSTTPNVGIFNVNGASALLRVNSSLVLANTTVNSAAAQNTFGVLNVNGGTALVNTVTVGALSTSASTAINLNNATLIVSNTLTTNATGLAVFSVTNSTVGLSVSTIGNTAGLVKTLNLAGTTNVLQLSIPVMNSYPQIIPLVQYTTLNGAFNMGMLNVPASAPGGYVTNITSTTPRAVALVLPTDPRPVITAQPSSYAGSPGDNITTNFSVLVSPGSVTPLGYQWYYVSGGSTNLLMDGTGPSGSSTLSGSTSSNLQILNAQPADSGEFFVVVTNVFGTNSSAEALLTISAGAIPPQVTGPATVTVTNGVTGKIANSVSGSPLPVLYWQYNNAPLGDGPGPSGLSTISGTAGSTVTIANPQLADQGTYSLIASNSAGLATNNTTLIVIVPPQITSQPVSLVVTNTQSASFTVAATGIPSPAFQWSKNNTVIAGATSPTFTIASTGSGDTANYSCTITNQAGTTNTVTVTLTVNSTMAATAMTPANGATGICYDTPLYITFNTNPVLRTAGTIKIYNINNSSTPVDTINLALNSNGVQPRSLFPGDAQGFNYYPVIITGTTAAIYPHSGVMTSNQTYYVTIDDGVFADSTGAYFAGIAPNAWQFSTKTGGPLNPIALRVAQDYSGDFATVQGAIDSVPSGNTTPTMVSIKNGNYVEIVNISGKNNLTLRGQSRSGTIVGYANNAAIASGGTTHARMAFKVNANDIALDNLTVTNSTPQDVSQAEALMIESGAARLIVNNCNVDSYQDTILANISTSKAYFKNDLVQGDVDFIWGGGNLFFTNCEIRYLIRAANAAALGPNPSPNAGSDINSNGFSFVSCALTTLPGANPNDTVGRTRSITNGNTALINCFVSTNIGGWFSDALPVTEFRNWYFGCTNDTGASVTLSNGIALAANDPNVTLASSSTAWLYGWVPQLSPNIIAQPVGQSISAGQSATLNVSATGVPDPSYQWLLNGVPINGATGSSYSIGSAVRTNGGNYSVVVNNGSGTVTSSVAVLTYINTPPVAPNYTIGALLGITETVPVINGLNPPTDVDGDALTITGVSTAVNGTAGTDGSNITYTATSGTSDAFTYTVSDGFGGSTAGNVSVVINTNVANYNQLFATVNNNGTNTMNFLGIPNNNYALDIATNLLPPINWMPVTTNPADINGNLSFTNVSTLPAAFYRSRHVP